MPSTEFDVGIVGAGPGGATAAKPLAAAGLRTVIFERAKLPRYKTCGGGLVFRTRQLFDQTLDEVIERSCFRAEFFHHGPSLQFRSERAEPVVSMVMRDRFDHLLVKGATARGAVLLEDTSVTDLQLENNHVLVKTNAGNHSVRFLIAADGVNSLVAKRSGYPELTDVVPALESEVTVSSEVAAPFLEAARFDFGLTPFGYAWVFPKAERLSIGVLTTRRGSCNLNEEYQKYLSALGIQQVVTEEKHGYMIPLRPRKRLFSIPRVLLVGDAAGLADPVTAEGISSAILSGTVAADSIIQNWERPNSVQMAYRDVLTARLLRELSAARVFAQALYHFPRLRRHVLSRHGRQLTELMTEIVMGRARYRNAFTQPSLYWKALFGRSP